MLKRPITYTDFNENVVTEVFYFNLTKTEIINMEVGVEGGLDALLRRIVEANDARSLVSEFQKLILASYGQKSDDGKKFVKSDELRRDFEQTAAYDALFTELCTNATAGALFVKGVIPKDLAAEADAMSDQDKPTGPPPKPSV